MPHAIEPAPVPLGSAEIIDLHGPDALAFAHAQFTSDVAGLGIGRWQLGAWLSAQGRTQAVFVLLRVESDRLLAWLPLGDARAIRDALARYVLRAKVTIEVTTHWQLASLDVGALTLEGSEVRRHGEGFAFAQPGSRVAWLGPAGTPSPDAAALNDWRRADIGARLAWIDPAVRDEFVPQALDLPGIDAIRFDKGCYPGQEIAARLHFRGGLKRTLVRVRLTGEAEVLPGLRILDEVAEAGVVLYAARDDRAWQALCVLSDAHASSSQLVSAHAHALEILAK